MSAAVVVEAQDSSSWSSGAGALETLVGTGRALGDGDWVESGVLGVMAGLDALGAASDPGGALVSAGVGWVLEHLQPLAGWFDELAGDPDQVHALAASWHAVAQLLHATVDEVRVEVAAAQAPWDGLWLESYLGASATQSDVVEGCACAMTGVAVAVETAGAVVAGVREVVREAIAEIVGWLLTRVAVLLSGVGTAPVLIELGARVMSWTSRVSRLVDGLLSSVRRLVALLEDLQTAFSVAVRTSRRLDALLDHPGSALAPGAAQYATGLDDRDT